MQPASASASASASAERYDNEYERRGTCALFMLFEPLAAWREVVVKARRTGLDYADVVRYLCDEKHPAADKIILVQDNLNTHSPASLYEAFPPAEAKRLADRLEIHYTPKHGSWLDMAELELSVLARQCLDDRIPDQATLADAVAAWEAERNAAIRTIDWRFTTADARIKLKHLYPVLQPII